MASKKKTKRAEPFSTGKPASVDSPIKKKSDDGDSFTVAREFVESVVIAIVLALLFRAFEAEAFVIPTGSMAPTLMGQHKDVADPDSGYEFQIGVSRDQNKNLINVNESLDPYYQIPMSVEREPIYPGDRILVSKFAYDLSAPRRWDVIVFKNPSKPEENYIKRLIGLPTETIKIRHGDIYVKQADETAFSIARKPPYKQLALLQDVYDTRYANRALIEEGFPKRFDNFPADDQAWQLDLDAMSYASTPADDQIHWLRYRHLIPSAYDLNILVSGEKLDIDNILDNSSQLILDYNAYNVKSASYLNRGDHWVGDLAVECRAKIQSEQGVLHLDLVEGGTHFRCSIEVKSGKATLEIMDSDIRFDEAEPSETITAQTSIQGPGTYDLRFANCDDQLRLWVNNSLVEFPNQATYSSPANVKPAWSEADPGDLLPVGIGSQQLDVEVWNLRILRDIYYIAQKKEINHPAHELSDYASSTTSGNPDIRSNVFKNPRRWANTDLFDQRREVEFKLDQDQFFPLGDNSAASLDGRLWEPDAQFVPRRLLIGKALVVYWPHSTHHPIPFFPNFSKMRFIK